MLWDFGVMMLIVSASHSLNMCAYKANAHVIFKKSNNLDAAE